ncbi:MAG: glycosyltransferase, partial [Patescibacteria group bacterium]
FISTDKKILEPGSAVAGRFEDYKKLFDEVHAVVLNRNIFSAYKTVKKLFRISDSRLAVGQVGFRASRDVVISVQDPFETGIVGIMLKLKFGVPLQIQLHTDFNNKYFLLSTPLNFARFFLAHLILPLADSVRVVSERVKRSIVELNPNITVLPIYIEKSEIRNPKSETNAENKKITILAVARLEKEKDLETAIKAFKIINRKYPNTEFVIVGDGRERKKLEKIAGKNVKFLGWRDDIYNLYTQADIYISTSLFEGYGMSMVEAASVKMPMVLSNAGIAGEVFEDGISALVCKPKDINCFTSALEKLIKDENLRLQMGESSYTAAMTSVISKETYLNRFKEMIVNTTPKSDLGRSVFVRMCRFAALIIERNRVLRFILAGGTSALSQIAVLYLFTDLLGIWYLYSSMLSFIFALFISFTLQKFWAFRDRALSQIHFQFAKYAVVILIGLLLNTALMYFFVDIVGIWYILSQIITGAIIAVFNFLSYRKYIFK